ncbi:MAG: Gfo/Idh/MocA family oxidoreductase [Gemmatimonadetes bacterium]|jgi:UDP-N-acetyl-2-amino-2-deoxyglucuronate dehydrogenase|nr:Gfo/Idh/MocA family oxidoreductase [Gemmatimonadota bacterium]MBT7862291.1 Gfo/Idh/MocA family oxidoreductase [Gemmatimonadota bacterium]
MKTYRVAILGCRGRGAAAARAYHQHPRTQLVGLCDLLADRRDGLGDELGIEARYDDFHRMIQAESPDIVAIPTATELHYQLAMDVLAHGVHIDIEKPLCQTLTEADEVLATASKYGVQVAVHHQGRCGGPMRALQAAVTQGRIGEPRYLQGSGKGYYAGYGLMNIGTHMLNNMLGIAGPCHHVEATALVDGRAVTPDDVIPAANGMGWILGEHLTAQLTFGDGVTATLLQHRFPKVDSTAYALEVYGTQGRLFWRSGAAWFLPVAHDEPGSDSGWVALDPIYPDSFDVAGSAAEADYAFADDFVQALDEDRPHTCSGVEGRHVMEIMMGIFDSAAQGRRIALPQADRNHPLLRWREEAGLGLPEQMPRPYHEWLEAEDHRLGRS